LAAAFFWRIFGGGSKFGGSGHLTVATYPDPPNFDPPPKIRQKKCSRQINAAEF